MFHDNLHLHRLISFPPDLYRAGFQTVTDPMTSFIWIIGGISSDTPFGPFSGELLIELFDPFTEQTAIQFNRGLRARLSSAISDAGGVWMDNVNRLAFAINSNGIQFTDMTFDDPTASPSFVVFLYYLFHSQFHFLSLS